MRTVSQLDWFRKMMETRTISVIFQSIPPSIYQFLKDWYKITLKERLRRRIPINVSILIILCYYFCLFISSFLFILVAKATCKFYFFKFLFDVLHFLQHFYKILINFIDMSLCHFKICNMGRKRNTRHLHL